MLKISSSFIQATFLSLADKKNLNNNDKRNQRRGSASIMPYRFLFFDTFWVCPWHSPDRLLSRCTPEVLNPGSLADLSHCKSNSPASHRKRDGIDAMAMQTGSPDCFNSLHSFPSLTRPACFNSISIVFYLNISRKCWYLNGYLPSYLKAG